MKRFFILAAFLCQYPGGPDWVRAQTPTPTPCCQGSALPTPITGMVEPLGMAINYGNGLVFVADSGEGALKVFNAATGGPVTSWTTFAGGTTFFLINDLAVDPNNGTLYASDGGNNAIYEFSSTFGYMNSLGSGVTPYQMRAVAVAPQGVTTSLYMATSDGSLFRFDSTNGGSTYGSAVTASLGNGSVGVPNGMAVVGNTVYLADDNGNIMSFTAPGYAPATVVSPGLGMLKTVRTDLAGSFYVMASLGALLKYTGNWSGPSSCPVPNTPWGAVVDTQGRIFIDETVAGSVTVLQGCATEPGLTPTPSQQGSSPPASGEFFIYPSPARGSQASLSYNMAQAGQVDFRIWNERAELVAHVTDAKPAGPQITPFSIAGFGSGVYFYALTLTYSSGMVEKLGPKKFVILH